jgi:hypothetical protein
MTEGMCQWARDPLFKGCVRRCITDSTGCVSLHDSQTAPDCSAACAGQKKHPAPMALKLLGWSCRDDCRQDCMKSCGLSWFTLHLTTIANVIHKTIRLAYTSLIVCREASSCNQVTHTCCHSDLLVLSSSYLSCRLHI